MNFLKTIKNYTNVELMFILTYGLCLINRVVTYSYFRDMVFSDAMYYVIFLIEMFLIGLTLWIENGSKNIFVYLLWAAMLLGIVARSDGIRVFVLIVGLMLIAGKIDNELIVKECLYVTMGMTLLIIFLSYCNVFKSVDISDNLVRVDGTVRDSLGFAYVTYASNFFLTCVFCWLYINREKRRSLVQYIIVFLMNQFLYMTTDTRAVYYIVLLMLVVGFVFQNKKSKIFNKPVIRFIVLMCYPLFAFVSVYFSSHYNESNKIYVKINNALSGRLRLGKLGITEYGYSLLGKSVEFRTVGYYGKADYFYIDSSFLQILLRYGVVGLLLVLIVCMLILKKAMDTNNFMYVIIMLAIGAHSIMDPQLFDVMYTPFLMFFISVLNENCDTSFPALFKQKRHGLVSFGKKYYF